MKQKHNAKGRNIPAPDDSARITKKERKFQVFMQKELKKQHAKEVLAKFETIEKVDHDQLHSSRQFGKKLKLAMVHEDRIEVKSDSESDSDDGQEYGTNFKDVEEQGIVGRAFDNDAVEIVEAQDAAIQEPLRKKRKRGKKSKPQTVFVPAAVEVSDSEEEVIVPTQTQLDPKRQAYHVPVNRTEEMQLARLALPVVGEEQQIMETIMANPVTILCGETGSGKTTQVPQFLYEAGFGDKKHPLYPGMIGVTQPRRVAAVSMASRVADEMNLHAGEVSYQIRYDRSKTGANTRIKFMTDGILLKELGSGVEDDKANDLLLNQYSCIIIDEAHERTIGTDILIGWLTRIVQLRNSGKVKGVGPLKLIIMSATLRVEDFTENKTLFPVAPPVIKVDGRQHKVVIHYNKVTPEMDYLTEIHKKVCKIHMKLPRGGVLVFVTGQQEVQILCRKLEHTFASSNNMDNVKDAVEDSRSFFDGEADVDDGQGATIGDDYDDLDASDGSDDEEEQVQVLQGTVDDELLPLEEKEERDTKTPVHVLPLYSLLSTQDQMKVFAPCPDVIT